MATVDVKSPSGAVTGSFDLPDAVFDVQVNIPLVHQVVVAQLAAARQGTHSTKTRGEVRAHDVVGDGMSGRQCRVSGETWRTCESPTGGRARIVPQWRGTTESADSKAAPREGG